MTELFLAAGLKVIAHCGAQTTAETVELAAHAAAAGADAVAVIAPPYFPLDDDALLAHFAAAAAACAPLPFYVYEFARASGYAVPLDGARAPARPRAEPRRPQGLRHAVGGVRAVPRRGARRLRRAGGADRAGHARAAVGAVSALASAFPERVAAAVRDPTAEAPGSATCAPRSSASRSTRR